MLEMILRKMMFQSQMIVITRKINQRKRKINQRLRSILLKRVQRRVRLVKLKIKSHLSRRQPLQRLQRALKKLQKSHPLRRQLLNMTVLPLPLQSQSNLHPRSRKLKKKTRILKESLQAKSNQTSPPRFPIRIKVSWPHSPLCYIYCCHIM